MKPHSRATDDYRSPELVPISRRIVAVVRITVGLVLFAAVTFAAARDWDEVRNALAQMSRFELALAELLALAGLGASVLTWRCALRELGSRVPATAASKIYLIGQLGKYLPGSLWALVFQMELARRAGAPRSRSLAASLVAVAINLVTGLAVGLLAIPSVAVDSAWRYAVAAAILLLLATCLVPAVLTRLVDLAMRIVRRPQLERRISWNGVLVGSGWSLVSWLVYGLSLWGIAVAAGAPAGESLPLCLAGVALAMTAGFLVVIAPSGIGVREAVLVAVLAPVLAAGPALGVALVLRAVFTLADLLAALVTLPIRIRAEPEG